MTSDYRILIGEVRVDRLREEDLYEIIDYGWDEHDLRRMLECRDYQAIACLAAWIRVDQDQYTGYRLVIRMTDRKHRMSIPEVVAAIRNTKRKPVIMSPSDPSKGMFADRREVLNVLMSTPDYEEYTVWMAEARMNGVI